MLGGDKLKYKMMWESLKDTAEIMIADGIVSDVSWRTLLDLMQQGEKMFEPEKQSSERTFLILFVNALEFGFANSKRELHALEILRTGGG